MTDPLKSIGKAFQKGVRSVGKATKDAIQDAQKGASDAAKSVGKGLESVKDGIETARDEAARTMKSTAKGVGDVTRSLVGKAMQFLHQGFRSLVTGEAARALQDAAGKVDAAARKMIGDIGKQLERYEPDWSKELGIFAQARKFLSGLEGIVFPKNDFKARDGESYVLMPQSDGSVKKVPYRPGEHDNVIHYMNGVNNTPDAAEESATALAKKSGRPVVVTYNATEGMPFDVLQSLGDKLDPFGIVNRNKATDSLTEKMVDAAKGGKEVDFVSHSQGTIITRNALMRTHARLYSEKFAEVMRETHNPMEAALQASKHADGSMKNVHVVAAAPAAWAWPSYGNVEHITNANDWLVANPLGQPAISDPREFVRAMFGVDVPALPTRDDLHVVNKKDDSGLHHGFQSIYLDDVLKRL